jgi:hypothetical protein
MEIPMPDFSHPEPKEVARAKRTAADFRTNEDYEHLLRLRDTDDPRWQQVSHVSRMGAALYESHKTIHQHITGGTA